MDAAQDWRDIYNALREEIRLSHFQAGSRLPTQCELCRSYKSSRHAVRRALKALADDGMISTVQGRGATVMSRPVLYQIGHKTRLATCLREQGHSVEIRALKTQTHRVLPPVVAGMLGLSFQDRVPFAEFMHEVDGVPTALGRHFFNAQRVPDILQEATRPDPSVPEAFSRSGIEDYYRASTLIEVRKSTAYEALALDIPPSQPVLSLLGKNVDDSGNPIEVTEAVVRTDTVRLEIQPHQIRDLA